MSRRATVHIHRLFGDKNEQGRLIATVVVDDYKFAVSNAKQVFVRDHKPPAGRYLAVTEEQYGCDHVSLIFDIKYAEAVIFCNGHTDIVGGDFRWSSYAVGSSPEWTYVGEELRSTRRD